MHFASDANQAFWQAFDTLLKNSEIVIDRPKDTAHPRMPEIIYPLDYGYLTGTTAGDGSGIDVWIGNKGGKSVNAIACTVDNYKRDAEVKVLLNCSDTDMACISHFLNIVVGLPCVIIKRAVYD